MSPEEILAMLVIVKEFARLLDTAAEANGYTKEDIDAADKNRAEAIEKFKKLFRAEQLREEADSIE